MNKSEQHAYATAQMNLNNANQQGNHAELFHSYKVTNQTKLLHIFEGCINKR